DIGEVMDIDPSEIWSVASFYTMINQEPVGKYVLQVCDNLPCLIEGAGDIVKHLETRLDIEVGETTPDELFTLKTVECMGSCGSAPMCQVNDEPYHENLSTDDVDELLEELRERAENGTSENGDGT
ncbi:MAG: NAD(P)H-dependent oxidoreductase subunit E, partial [bacterium]